jgi:hypothetical protein
MADNEVAIKITGDASELKDATDVAKEQLDKAAKSVDMLGDLIGFKLPDAIKEMIASSELIAPALDAAFAPLAVISLGVAIFDAAEKVKQHREELEKSRLEALDVALSFDKQAESVQISNLKLQDHIAQLERKPAPNGIAIAATEGKLAMDDLIKSFQDAIAKENELLTAQEQGFFNKLLDGDSGINGIIDKVKEFQAQVTDTLIKLRLARQEGNKGQSAEYQAELNKELEAYKKFLNDQLSAGEVNRQKDLSRQQKDSEKAIADYLKRQQTIGISGARLAAITDKLNKQELESIKAIDKGYDATAQTIRSLLTMLTGFGNEQQALGKHSALVGAESLAEQARKAQDEYEKFNKWVIEQNTETEKRNEEQAKKEVDQAIAGVDRKVKATIKGWSDSAAAADEYYKGQIEAAKQDSEIKIQQIEQQFERGKITQQQEIAAIAKAKQDELALEVDYHKQRLELWHKDQKEVVAIENQIAKAQKQSILEQTKAVTDGLKAQEQQYKSVFQQIGNSFKTEIMGMIQGTETITQGFSKMFNSLVSSFADYVAQKAEKKAEEWLIDKLFTQKKISSATAASSGIAALAGFASAMQALPFPINISTAPGVAAAAGATASGMGAIAMGAASLAIGTDYVPMDGFAYLHKGEKVIPASMQGSGYSGGVGGVTVVVNHSVSAVDAASFQGHIRRHSNMIANEVTRALKRKGAR